ncbi:MOSC domain-containing protein [Leisingera sp. ANG-Vp]|uniref:MOSC domain-containing protein n=1 Tax=Leisingera sp. ANG-Vp TaxID=1577896 RepID=UPI00057EEC91|nr:MOSC domain-containing protein [Leisingera sp. ANG-Vp]KIC15176.1 molybdenum cofactor biosysynthesis protein [Leisingera sp. ANG-Vp]
MQSPVSLAEIWRHPIKGIGAEPLEQVGLTAGAPMPLDRAWAVLTGTSQDTGAWQHCRNFARGCFGPELMAVTAETQGETLTLRHPKREDLTIDPRQDGARLIDWLSPLYPAERPQPHSLIQAPAGGMADAETPAVSIMSLSSLQALSEELGQPLDVRRFRGNLWLDGGTPFEEFSWIGQTLKLGALRLKVLDRIARCRATEANPDTGERDADTLKALRSQWGHTDFGILAEVLDTGELKRGDRLEVL